MYPHGIQHRFHDWSLDVVFGSLRSFVEACQWQQFRALKYEIQALRRKQQIAGYVITELTDVHWESNGLMDMRRNQRVFHKALRDVNADVVLLPQWERVSYWDDEQPRLSLCIANGGSGGLSEVTVTVGAEAAAARRVAFLPSGAISEPAEVELLIPRADHPQITRVEFAAFQGAEALARTHVDLSIVPATFRTPSTAAPIWAPDPEIAEYLHGLGYRVGEGPDVKLAITRWFDRSISTFVRDGGRLLLLPDREGLIQPLFPHWQNVRVQRRDGTLWRGDWASTFSWLRRSAAFSSVPGGPLLDEAFDRVLPAYVISGCNLLDFQARVHAGLVVGWVHKAVAITVERAYGRGHFVTSTFRLLRDPPGTDPIATLLLQSHINLALGSTPSR
jgi:hypothetical protein